MSLTLKFDLLVKNFNLSHNFQIRRDRAFILHRCVSCDKIFQMVPWFLTLWPWPWSLTYFWKTLTLDAIEWWLPPGERRCLLTTLISACDSKHTYFFFIVTRFLPVGHLYSRHLFSVYWIDLYISSMLMTHSLKTLFDNLFDTCKHHINGKNTKKYHKSKIYLSTANGA